MMPNTSTIVGKRLHSIQKKDYSWFFVFTDDLSISTESSWRFINAGRIVVTSDDHGHQFGLPDPVDAAESVCSVLQESEISSARIDETTGDLFVVFSNAAYLQFLQMSSGYESWRLCVQGDEFICLGGGEVTSMSKQKESS